MIYNIGTIDIVLIVLIMILVTKANTLFIFPIRVAPVSVVEEFNFLQT